MCTNQVLTDFFPSSSSFDAYTMSVSAKCGMLLQTCVEQSQHFPQNSVILAAESNPG